MKNDLNLSAGEWVMPSISLYLYLRGGGKKNCACFVHVSWYFIKSYPPRVKSWIQACVYVCMCVCVYVCMCVCVYVCMCVCVYVRVYHVANSSLSYHQTKSLAAVLVSQRSSCCHLGQTEDYCCTEGLVRLCYEYVNAAFLCVYVELEAWRGMRCWTQGTQAAEYLDACF